MKSIINYKHKDILWIIQTAKEDSPSSAEANRFLGKALRLTFLPWRPLLPRGRTARTTRACTISMLMSNLQNTLSRCSQTSSQLVPRAALSANRGVKAQLEKHHLVSSTPPSSHHSPDREDLILKESKRKMAWSTRWAWRWKTTSMVLNR